MKIKKYNELIQIDISNIKNGDYVICKYASNIKVDEFVRNNIGKLIEIDNSSIYPYIIQYYDIWNDNII